MANINGRVSIRLPWWWRLYLGAAQFCVTCGIEVDPKTCSAFIARHSRVELA